jgi:hypothetical protein
MFGYDTWGLNFTSNYQINFANVIKGFSNDTNAFMRIINDTVEVYNDALLASRAFGGKQYFKQQVAIGVEPATSTGRLFEAGTTNLTPPGTISVTASGTTVTGTNTTFLTTFMRGQTITANGETRTITNVASNTSMTTDAWTSAFSGAYTVAARNNIIVYQNGMVALGNNTNTAQATLREFQVGNAHLNNTSNLRTIYSNGVYSQTSAAYSGNVIGFYAQPAIGGTNTQNWTSAAGGAGGLVGIYINPSTNSGATGTLSRMVGGAVGMVFSGMTTTEAASWYIENPSGSATVNNNTALVIDKQTKGATSNIHIKSATIGNPTGTYFIYDSSTYANYLTGTIHNANAGSTTAATYAIGLANTGLYQSAAGRIDMTVSGSNLYRWDNTGSTYILSNNNLAGHYIGLSSDVGLYRGSSGGTLNLYQNSGAAATISSTKMTISRTLNIGTVSEYADNAAALAGGLVNGDVYRTGDILKIVHP